MPLLTLDASEVKALARDLYDAGPQVKRGARPVISRTGHAVVSTAQANAPVDTGDLKGSIGVDVTGLSFEAGPTVYYGGYVEEGTAGPYPIPNAFGWGITVMHPGNTPRPYLGPAFDVHVEGAVQAFGSLGANIL